MAGPESEVSTIPQLRRVFRLTKAELDNLMGLRDGAFGYATDEGILYRQLGDGAANWEAIAGRTDFPMKLTPALTRHVIPGWYGEAAGVTQCSIGMIFYIPIFVSETTTYDRICIEVTTGNPGTADLRIYNYGNGLPTTQVLSAGTVDTTNVGIKTITINQILTRGYYFLAIRCTGQPTCRRLANTGNISPPVPGFKVTSNPDVDSIVLTVIAAMADPATAPEAGYPATYTFVWLREA